MAENIFSQLAKHELESLKKMLIKLERTCNERVEKKEKLLYDQRNLLKKKKVNGKKSVYLENLMKNKNFLELVNFKKNKISTKLHSYKKDYSEIMAKVGRKEYIFEDDVNDYSKKELNYQRY